MEKKEMEEKKPSAGSGTSRSSSSRVRRCVSSSVGFWGDVGESSSSARSRKVLPLGFSRVARVWCLGGHVSNVFWKAGRRPWRVNGTLTSPSRVLEPYRSSSRAARIPLNFQSGGSRCLALENRASPGTPRTTRVVRTLQSPTQGWKRPVVAENENANAPVCSF